jgi:hypothetical protein
MNIYSKSELQKNIGNITNLPALVLNRGKPEFVIVPYYDGSEEFIADYLEELDIKKHQDSLQEKLRKSKNSGISDLRV